MKRTAAYIIMLWAIVAVAAAHARAQSGGGSRNRAYGFLMMEEPVNPRNIGMGSAGAALGGPGGGYYNPAAPFFSPAPYVSAEFGQMPGGVNKGGFESAVIFPKWFAALSLYSSSVDFETRDERGEGAEASSATTIGALTAGYSRENLSLAVSLTAAEDRIWVESSYSAITLSLGLGYRLMDNKLTLGAALSHYAAWSKGLGGSSEWGGEGLTPKYARAGAAWTDTLRSFPYTIAADAVYHDEDGKITVPLGVDVRILPYLSLRLGKRIGWDNEVMSFGIGFNIDRIAFDAAFVPTVFVNDYEMKWSMSFTYRLGARMREQMPPLLITPSFDSDMDVDADSSGIDTDIGAGRDSSADTAIDPTETESVEESRKGPVADQPESSAESTGSEDADPIVDIDAAEPAEREEPSTETAEPSTKTGESDESPEPSAESSPETVEPAPESLPETTEPPTR